MEARAIGEIVFRHILEPSKTVTAFEYLTFSEVQNLSPKEQEKYRQKIKVYLEENL
jgi:hypothetical protein